MLSNKRRRTLLLLAFFCCVLPVFLWMVEASVWFKPLKSALQTDAVPTGILNYGEFGKILKNLGYVQLVDNDGRRFPRTGESGEKLADAGLELIPFQKKRRVDEYLFKARPERYGKLVESFFPHGVKQKEGWPILAINLPEEDLNDADKGIIRHRDKQGRDWERKAEVIFLDEGGIVFSSAAGLRVHGGKRRLIKPFQSYRLHFRKKYGMEEIPAGLVLEKTGAIKNLVVQMTDWPPGQPMNNPLAYDISAQMGCIVPETKLVEVYLNGTSIGSAFITEHLSRRQWDQYVPGGEYLFYKFRGNFTPEDERLYFRRFWAYAADKKQFSLRKVASSIDIDNFTRHLFSWVFNGTTDACQGVGFLDTSDPEAKLRWINWDMDHSYWDRFAVTNSVERPNWQQEGLALIYIKGNNYCDRSVLFTRLINESDEYRQYFSALVTETLNHQLTEEFLLARVAYYARMLKQFGTPQQEYIAMLEEFMRHRADFIRAEMVNQLGLGSVLSCRVETTVDQPLLIDGYRYAAGYSGWYFKGQKIVLEPDGAAAARFSHWLVDGRKVAGPRLEHVVEKEVAITAVFTGR